MALTYPQIKRLAVDLIDDFSKFDIVASYGTTFTAKTKLDDIEITAPIRAVMIVRVNKVISEKAGTAWRDVRPVDTVKCTTIGDFLKLLCRNAGVAILPGEPK